MNAVAAQLKLENGPTPLAGSWHWDCATGACRIDADWCQPLGIDPCSGSHQLEQWIRQIHPDDVENLRLRLNELQLGASLRVEVEYRILTLQHRWLWVLHRAQVVRRAARGAVLEVAGLCLDIDQRRQREAEVRANESRLATALWGARAAFWQWHLPTDVRSESPMWFAITQHNREQWERHAGSWRARLHPADWPAVERAIADYIGGVSDSLQYEYRLQTADGNWKWLLDRARAVEWDLEGKPLSIMGVTLDIDPQKKSEAALRESEARLQTAIWGARMGLWELDVASKQARWFDNWCQRYGIDPCASDDHVKVWNSHIHPEDAAEASRSFTAHLEGLSDYYDSEYRIRAASGEYLWIFERGRVVERDAAGKALRVVGVCMDMDERRREELQRHFIQPWLEEALKIARGGMWHWDVDSKAVTYTDTYFRLLGVDPSAGRADSSFWEHHIHPDDYPRIIALCRDVAAGRAEEYDTVYRMRHVDGYYLTVQERARPMVRLQDGTAPTLVGFVRELGEGGGAPAQEL